MSKETPKAAQVMSLSVPSGNVEPCRKPLDVRHERFAAARAEGQSIASASKLAGVSERNGKRWDDDDRVIALRRSMEDERRLRIRTKSAVQMERWLDTLSLPAKNVIDLYKATNLDGDGGLTVNLTVMLQMLATKAAEAEGLDPAEVLAEANHWLAEHR